MLEARNHRPCQRRCQAERQLLELRAVGQELGQRVRQGGLLLVCELRNAWDAFRLDGWIELDPR